MRRLSALCAHFGRSGCGLYVRAGTGGLYSVGRHSSVDWPRRWGRRSDPVVYGGAEQPHYLPGGPADAGGGFPAHPRVAPFILGPASPWGDSEPGYCRCGPVCGRAPHGLYPAVYRPDDHRRDVAVYAAHSLEDCFGGHFHYTSVLVCGPICGKANLLHVSPPISDPRPSDRSH